MNPDLSLNIAGITFRNPILLASGTVGYGHEIAEWIDLNTIGGIVTKSLSLKPRKGNSPQRIVETPAGMLNAIGLANVGVDEFIKHKIPFLEKFNTNLICNIAASTVDEYVACVKELTVIPAITAFEINVSCPNVKDGGLLFGNDLHAVASITEKTKAISRKPIIIKLSPNVPSISEFAAVAKREGADAVSAINTLVGSAIDIYTRKPKLQNVTGGLSGPAIKPVAIAKVLEIRRKVAIPIIGIGGIMTWKDAAEFLIAGASLVQLGTVNFINPKAAEEVIDGLREFCVSQNIHQINELSGSVRL